MGLLLDISKVSKEYSGVKVLHEVDFQLNYGEVHVLFGENGAGKSTLVSIISGVNTSSGGEIRFKGNLVDLKSVHAARDLGISAVFQEFSLVPEMTVEENIFLGSEITKWNVLEKKKLHRNFKKLMKELDFHLSPNQKVKNLTRAEQQMVEIAKAFRSELSILILDEPTASLTNYETEQLFKLINKLKKKGVGIIYISHRLAEISEIGDRITVLRDGRHVSTVNAKTVSEDELINLMTGRVYDQIYPNIDFKPGKEILKVENLSTADGSVIDASISLKRGEIVGFAGLIGSGKSEFAQVCFGKMPLKKGKIIFKEEDVTGLTVSEMLSRGFLYLPSDRFTEGLIMVRSAKENISLISLHKPPFSKGVFLDKKEEIQKVTEYSNLFSLSPMKINQRVEFFSGGNQQKIMFARCLTQNFDLFVFDEPTVGVDVGARIIIYDFIAKLCERGASILLISSDLPEVLHLSNRIYVFHRGVIKAELQGNEISESNVLSNFFEKKVV